MYKLVVAFLEAATETSGLAKLPALLILFKAKVLELIGLGVIQTQDVTAPTSRRNEVLGAMIAAALNVASLVAAYAHEHGIPDLLKTMTVTPGAFKRLRLAHRPWLAQRIHDGATAVLPQLTTYNVTAEMLADLQTKIDAANTALNEPRSTIVARAGATQRVAQLFEEADGLLEGQIDRLIYTLRETEPDFYNRYLSARMVSNAPGVRPENRHVTPLDGPAAAPGSNNPQPKAHSLAA